MNNENFHGENSFKIHIKKATEKDVPLILSFIKGLAEYERLTRECVATEELLRDSLFGNNRSAEVVIAFFGNTPAGFALFFHNYSTFLAQPGIYLEDLYVIPEMRRKGIGRALLVFIAQLAKERKCGRMEWSVLDWNDSAILFYKKLGAVPLTDWTMFRIVGKTLDRLAAEINDINQ